MFGGRAAAADLDTSAALVDHTTLMEQITDHVCALDIWNHVFGFISNSKIHL